MYGLNDVVNVLRKYSPCGGRILEYVRDQCAEYLNKLIDRHARFLKNAQHI